MRISNDFNDIARSSSDERALEREWHLAILCPILNSFSSRRIVLSRLRGSAQRASSAYARPGIRGVAAAVIPAQAMR